MLIDTSGLSSSSDTNRIVQSLAAGRASMQLADDEQRHADTAYRSNGSSGNGDKPISILLVEADAEYAQLLRRMIAAASSAHFQLTHVEGMELALRHLSDEPFDAILLDLAMREARGLEAVVCLNEQVPDLPIVVLAEQADDALTMEVLRHGAQDYVVKDRMEGNLLVRSIRHAIERKQVIVRSLWRYQRLRHSEAHFRALVENGLDMITILNGDATIHYSSPSVERMLGYAPAELIGATHFEFVHPHDLPKVMGALTRATQNTGVSQTLEFRFRHKDGSWRVLESITRNLLEDAAIGGLLVNSRDITDRRQAEEALEASEEYASCIIDSSLDMIIAVDRDHKIIEFNRAAQETFGYRPEEIVGQQVSILYAEPQEGLRVHQTTWEKGRCITEVLNRRKDGEVFSSFLSSSTLRDARGELVGAMGVSRDITRRRRAEQELRDSNQRLEEALAELRRTQQRIIQQERLHALGQMACGIAHDFNNALSPILGFTDLLLMHPEKLADDEKLRRYLKMMNTAAHDAASVVRRLREFYRQREETDIFLPVDLNQLIEQTIGLTQPRWKDEAQAKGISIDIEADLQPIPSINGNEAELREALTNLIFNAMDAMPRGGNITVRTCAVGEFVVVEVSDTGVGMVEDVRRRCLEPFFSTKGDEGTGLGLAMVHGIIRRHEANIAIVSKPGRGTTFIISLPTGVATQSGDTDVEDQTLCSPLRVLVVDDEPLVRETVSEYLAADGHYVESVSNGCEALERFNADTFDLIITDRGMPAMNGDQLAATVKRVAPGVPIILLTGWGDHMRQIGEKPESVDLIVSKPVSIVELRRAVAQAISSPSDACQVAAGPRRLRPSGGSVLLADAPVGSDRRRSGALSPTRPAPPAVTAIR